MYSKENLKKDKEEGNLEMAYQLTISLRNYLKKYGLFEQGTTNADAVILYSSSCKTLDGLCCMFLCCLSFQVKKFLSTL